MPPAHAPALHAPVFEALIVPHRSLTPRGLAIVVAVLAVLSACVAVRFLLVGAWPVVAFSALEAPLLVLLLWINQRRARVSELIMLDDDRLIVIRTNSRGKRDEIVLPSAWLRVDLRTPEGVPHVMLSSHGRDVEVGAFLHEPEKTSLFASLRDALQRIRNPRFDNPQLRDA